MIGLGTVELAAEADPKPWNPVVLRLGVREIGLREDVELLW